MLDILGEDILIDTGNKDRKNSSDMDDSQLSKEYNSENDSEDGDTSYARRFYIYWKDNLLISPDNVKLRYFHLIVAIVLYFDFYLTGCMMANYRYAYKLSGYDH
jgi:hypothetical protein